MRKTLLVVLTALALVLGFAAMANAAAKPAYKVSLRTSTTSSQAGKFIVVSGKVTGPGASGKSVTVQRRYVGGAWVTVASATVKPSGAFSARVETPQGGNTSFRAIKGKSSARKAGTSPVRTTKVFEWLFLANQAGSFQDVIPFEDTISGVHYTHALTFEDDSNATWRPSLECTSFTTRISYEKGTTDPADDMDLVVDTTPVHGADTETSVPVTTGSPKTATVSLAGAKYLELSVNGFPGTGSYDASLGDPKVYCNAPYLPEFNISDE
ncbi:MAG: hypothetical protein JWP74_250 [Marmoricola sp.]|nr:hypothetical protein [Marmoricola sp.]